MSLSSAQLTALKNDLAANATTLIYNGQSVAIKDLPDSGDACDLIAAWYNLVASPDFWVWRSFVADSEIYETTTSDGTAWSWSIYIARSQGERDAWRQMVNMKGGLNASLANVRTGIADIFSGAGGANQRTHLLTVGRRKATTVEKLLSTGTGSTASPAVLGYEGSIIGQNVFDAKHA